MKVTCLNPKNIDPAVRKRYATNNETEDPFAGPWDKYLNTANYLAFELQPKLAITHGFSGSGKSTVAMNSIVLEGGVRISSDAERHRLAKKFKTQNEYSVPMSDWVYAHLLELAISGVNAGFPVVVDATFLSQQRRLQFAQTAKDKSLAFEILDCDAPFEELCNRIRNRGTNPSEATIDVLKMQMAL